MKKNIAVVMGGYSDEYEISIKSGNVVADNLDNSKYNIYKIHILTDKWVAVCDAVEIPINKADFSIQVNGKKIIFDAVFNAIHGNPGEDGNLVAYFDLLKIRHTSAPFYQMALTFNKYDTICILEKFGIKAAKSIYLNKYDTIDINAIEKSLKLPCFVKANNAGSSFGVTKVHNKENLKKAISHAFSVDDGVLIESFLDGTEVTVGVVKIKDEILVLPMTEIVSENDYFDYEAKYLGKSQEITPARITKKEHQKLHDISLHIYKVLNMTGMSRADFILINGEPHFIEINTVPGLSEASILPQQIRAAGYTLETFFGMLVDDCLIS